MKFYVSFLILCLPFCVLSQEIDFSQIESKKVKKALINNQIQNVDDFENFLPRCFDTDSLTAYSKHERIYVFDVNAEQLWNSYLYTKPNLCWEGKRTQFGLLYEGNNRPLIYKRDHYGGMAVGQTIFIELKLFAGLVKLAVAHQVKSIDYQDKIINICYMANGASEGGQIITLKSLSEGKTEVNHTTYYRSKSKFRDKNLYPGIHNKIITEYHESVLAQALSPTNLPLLSTLNLK